MDRKNNTPYNRKGVCNMEANKNPSCYEEALLYIEELKLDIKVLRAMIKLDDELIAKYKELVEIYKKELGE